MAKISQAWLLYKEWGFTIRKSDIASSLESPPIPGVAMTLMFALPVLG